LSAAFQASLVQEQFQVILMLYVEWGQLIRSAAKQVILLTDC
jgi:hypothetical protein